ncbi:MAG: DUF3662 domain-containing protein [Chloroflexi bacterium]|nr:DUF3662 domain-containing protein [Chloroflexota bacterium]
MMLGRWLAGVERLLSGLVEGAAGALWRAPVQPAQIARRLEAAMEDGLVAGVSSPVTPNRFLVTLDSLSLGRFAGAQTAVQRDLERHLAMAAARRGVRALDPFEVELRAGPVGRGRLTVAASFAGSGAVGGAAAGRETRGAQERASGGGVETTTVMPAAPVGAETAAFVLGTEGGERRVAIPAAGLSIGRGAENGLVLDDRAASRRHAVVRRGDGGYVIADLGSTNGVRVNGRAVRTVALRDGDRVQIGEAALVFRELVLGLRAATVAALFLFLGVCLRTLRDELTAAAASAEAAPDALAGWLEVVEWEGAPERAGRRYPLERSSTVGRAPGATVMLADSRVSALHARLVWRGGGWWIEDLDRPGG